MMVPGLRCPILNVRTSLLLLVAQLIHLIWIPLVICVIAALISNGVTISRNWSSIVRMDHVLKRMLISTVVQAVFVLLVNSEFELARCCTSSTDVLSRVVRIYDRFH
jgi:hypothetical protein